MRPSPGWKKYGDIVDVAWKWELLRWLARLTGIEILVETGTCHGATCYELRNDFLEIYTVELHPGLYEGSRQRLQQFSNIHQYLGDSRNLLASILLDDVPSRPTMFWLDAHSSGPHTADAGDPLAGELEIIMRLRDDALIVIDDTCDAELRHVTEAGVSLSGWHREYRTGEVIMYREGRYAIPQFEDA